MKSFFDEIQQENIAEISEYVAANSSKVEDESDLDPLMEKIGDARLVLLGEASHGTHEYYMWRARITQRLIKEKGFSFVGVEGDWPDCYRINRFVKGYKDAGEDSMEILKSFKRWPTWMWANWEIKAFMEWLREENNDKPIGKKVGFYGLDVYSLWESILMIIDYLDKTDPKAAEKARAAANCFEPFGDDEGVAYARSTEMVPSGCEDEVIEMLQEIVRKIPQYDSDQEAVFSTEQNAYVTVNAEKYYRAMIKPGPDSWNIRDRHMAESLDRLLSHHGENSKAIVWEHNTHIGDARATRMSTQGMVNIGQLVREKYGKENTVLVGFGSYKGSVIAGKNWGAPMEKMPVPPARANSWEAILHAIEPKDKLMIMDGGFVDKQPKIPVGHRAIGVVYRPDQEYYGNYVASMIPSRYDSFIFLDETEALNPIHIRPDGDKMPETYPWKL